MANEKSSNRPFCVWVKKEEYKGDQFARLDLSLVTKDAEEEDNLFVKSSRFTQTYPSNLFAEPDTGKKGKKGKKGKGKKKGRDDDGEFICC